MGTSLSMGSTSMGYGYIFGLWEFFLVHEFYVYGPMGTSMGLWVYDSTIFENFFQLPICSTGLKTLPKGVYF